MQLIYASEALNVFSKAVSRFLSSENELLCFGLVFRKLIGLSEEPGSNFGSDSDYRCWHSYVLLINPSRREPQNCLQYVLSLLPTARTVSITYNTYCHYCLQYVLSLLPTVRTVTIAYSTYCHYCLHYVLSPLTTIRTVTIAYSTYCHHCLHYVLSPLPTVRTVTIACSTYCHYCLQYVRTVTIAYNTYSHFPSFLYSSLSSYSMPSKGRIRYSLTKLTND
jgi:hypothetical protein